jgi:hypothetical protein
VILSNFRKTRTVQYPNSNRTVPKSNFLLIFLLKFIGKIRRIVISYYYKKLKVNFKKKYFKAYFDLYYGIYYP